jgi:hypothetical protein
MLGCKRKPDDQPAAWGRPFPVQMQLAPRMTRMPFRTEFIWRMNEC